MLPNKGILSALMKHPFKAYFSNRVEKLFEELKGQIFMAGTNPFTKRYIIVPSPAMKNWVMTALASDPAIGIAAGVHITTIETALKDIIASISAENAFPKKKSEMELSLKLEVEIRRIIIAYHEMDEKTKVIWHPLLRYILPEKEKSNPAKLQTRESRRILALSVKLANLFITYGKYGSRMLRRWEDLQANEKHWQCELWKRCINEIYPEETQWKNSNATIHAFGMSFISKQDHSLFTELSKSIPVNYYLLSPCQAFWSEILSDHECKKLIAYWQKRGASEAQKLALEEYIFDRNPLLANLGRVGREMAMQVENSQMLTKEIYEIPEEINKWGSYQDLITEEMDLAPSKHALTLLNALQADLLLMRNPVGMEKINFNGDQSLQCLIASSSMREVQMVYDTLLGIIQKHHLEDEKIFPEDIIVMAPDIIKYEPFIRSVFSQNENKLDYQLMDLNLLNHNAVIQGFNLLLNLAYSRWDVTSVLQLFENPSFQQKLGFSLDDIAKIHKWIQSADVRWGEDPSHRKEILNRELDENCTIDSDPSGTWSAAIDRLLLGMAMIYPEEELGLIPTLPLNEIDASQATLFGKWIRIMNSLSVDLKVIADGKQLTLKEWSLYLTALLESYFDSSKQNDTDEEALLHLEELIQSIKLDKTIEQETFSFITIKYHLERSLKKHRISYKESHLHAVRFCSMLPMRALPAKVVVLMGMNEESYPRADAAESLNLLKSHPERDYCPSQPEFDRYLFLETILSARQYYILTYSGYSKNDGKEQHPSLLISELLDYLNQGYTIDHKQPSDCILKRYPFNPYDRRLFEKDSGFHSYSEMYYRAAKVLYSLQDKLPPHNFISSFASNFLPVAGKMESIDLKMLANLAKNPIETYLRNTLGMYFKEEEKLNPNEEDFLLDALGNHVLKKSTLKAPFEKVLDLAEKEGMLPLGPFKSVSLQKLKKEVDEFQDVLLKSGLRTQDICKLTISEQFTSPVKNDKGEWNVPPLECRCNGKIIKIVGTLPEITRAGMLTVYECKKTKILQLWPQYLVFLCLLKQYQLPFENKLIFLDGGSEKAPFFTDPFPHLEKYVAYYLQALDNISPLLPDWVPEIMNGSKSFEKKIHSDLSERNEHFHNHSLKWVVRGSKLPDHESILSHWKETAEDLFGELFTHWFKSKKNGGGVDQENE
jgi:exodeoxyribonuclease V gamma subunit